MVLVAFKILICKILWLKKKKIACVWLFFCIKGFPHMNDLKAGHETYEKMAVTLNTLTIPKSI